MSGVRPEMAPQRIDTDLGGADPLLDAARPVLDAAATQLSGTAVSLLLVDAHCRMVSRVAVDHTVERTLDDLGVAEGIDFAEDAVGTTALGTPVETRSSIAINGEEHYLEQFKGLSCFGRPIIHPASRRLAGILCLTEVGPRINSLAIPFVNGIVADITDHLLDRSRARQRQVLDAFQRLAPRRDVAVAAIGDDLQLTNSLANSLLSASDLGLLQSLAADRAALGRSLRLVLSAGTEAEIEVTGVAGAPGAALFRIRPIVGRSTSTIPPVRPTAVAASIAVTGEPGTGRSRRARELAAGFGGTPVIADVVDDLISGRPTDVTALLRQSRQDGTPLVIDGADLLDDRALALLARAAETASASAPLVVVAAAGGDPRPQLTSLVTRCARRIDLPPLRQRTTEIAALARAILAEIGDRHLSSTATDALLSQDWPGNLTELCGVLEQAANASADRGAGVVDLDDLPPEYRTTSRARHLSGREQAERQAVLDALEATGGNKARAAKLLGISRSTLYARLPALGIDG